MAVQLDKVPPGGQNFKKTKQISIRKDFKQNPPITSQKSITYIPLVASTCLLEL